MDKSLIKKHNFEEAKNKIRVFSNNLPTYPHFDKVEESGGLFNWGNHNVTGNEMNTFVSKVQDRFISVNSSLRSVVSEFREIYKALMKLISLDFFSGSVSIRNDKRENILDCGSAKDIIDLFNMAINTIAYDKFPINSEHALESLIMLYLLGAGVDVCAESHSSKGRSDLKIERENRRIIIELKYGSNEKEAKQKLSEAIEQIKSRDYGNTLPVKTELLRIAAVYNSDPSVRNISDFELV